MRWVLAIAILCSALPAVGQAPPLEHMDVVLRSVPDGPVAHVNGSPVPRAEFVQLYSMEVARLRQAAGDTPIDNRKRIGLALRALAQLVNEELLYQEAKKSGIVISAKDIEARWAEQMDQYRQAEPGVTEAVVLERMGVTERAHLLEEVERMLLVDRMAERIVEQTGVAVSDTELKELYAKNKDNLARPDSLHLRQLFVRAGAEPAAREAAKKRAEHALARINAGQRFEAVVKEMSDSPGAAKGGDMGPWPISEFPPFLVEPALKLKPDAISGIIESEYGFHIIQMVSAEKGSDLTFDSAKPLLERTLRAKKGEDAVLAYCDKLVNGEADILIYLELEKTLATDPDFKDLLEPAETS